MRSMVVLFNLFHETRSQLFSWTVHSRLQLGLYYLFHEMRKWLLSQLYNICLTLFRLGDHQIDTCLPFSPYLRHGFCSESEQTYRNRVKTNWHPFCSNISNIMHLKIGFMNFFLIQKCIQVFYLFRILNHKRHTWDNYKPNSSNG